ncbi:MAG TPA: hypothetical protein PLP17_09655, partial [Oligoflexia bacterium]|nr:hypothetical protein [Oligoflexia bacterium]
MHKQKFTLLFDLVIFAASFLLAPQTLLAQAAREPLGLDGANLVHMAVSADAHLTFAGCQGPLGIFYSTDFGGTWNDARDDVYTGGEAKSFAIANNTLFAVAGFDLYYTSLAGDRPEWSQLEWPDGVEFEAAVLAAAGNFVVMGQGWLPKLRVYNAATEDLGPEVQIPDTQGVSSIAIDAPNGYVYVLTGSWQATNAEVYRADFDTETGAVSNWVKREPGASTGRFWRVFTAPNGDVYVYTFTFGEGIFKSTNFGDSYTRLKDSTAADIDNQVGFMQFAGDVGLLGEYYSTDGGTTWYFQGDDFLAPEDRILGASPIGTAGVLHPADVTQALMRSDVGVTKTEDLSTQDYPFWLPASSGLQGVVVNDMAQLASDKNVVVLASDSGVAFTNSFLDDDPNWIFPLFPLGAGGGSTAAVFDPNEDGRFFLGAGDVYEGSVTAAGSSSPISWQMRDQRDGSEQYRMVMELSVRGTVLAACFASLDGAVDGALQFYDIANGSFTETDTFLDGRPVNTFVAVNQNLFFAGLGVWSPITGSLNGDNRGVWQSTNGGQSW